MLGTKIRNHRREKVPSRPQTAQNTFFYLNASTGVQKLFGRQHFLGFWYWADFAACLSRTFEGLEGLAGDAAPYAVMDNRQTLIFQLLKSQR